MTTETPVEPTEPASKRILESNTGISSHLATLTQLQADARTWTHERKGVAILLDMYLQILEDAIKVVTSLADYFEQKAHE